MKKIIYLFMASALLYSCQVEDIDQNGALESVKSTYSDCEIDLTPDLPDYVNACVTEKGVDAVDSYFNLNISDTFLAGDYDAWCIDQDTSLDDDDCFEAAVYSSYETLPAGEFENPDNFDLVNWLINENYIGQTSSSDGEAFTFGDVQRAIWYLIDDSNCELCEFLGPFSDARALELASLAGDFGEGYEPGEGDQLVVVLIPVEDFQNVFITITLECEEEPVCETAFAFSGDQEDCFLNFGFDRWGWRIGPITEGENTYDVYAGAGQCDLNKGTLVGTVTLNYSDGNVGVNYNLDAGYSIEEEHTYAGYDMFPTNKKGNDTVAPGKYTITEDLNGEIYVILHTVVCGDFD